MSAPAEAEGSAPRGSPWRAVGPGLLVAATGVGAGDLATGAFSGSALGLAVLWAVWVGAFFKYVLTEGLARWQLVSGETVLDGALLGLPRPLRWFFLLYLLPWSWFVGSALISACGVTMHALLPVLDRAAQGKTVWGALASAVGVATVMLGGFRGFARLMNVCIGLMFVSVIWTAVRLEPDWGAVLRGTLVPTIPDADGLGLSWTIALIGGVGGTLTLLSYGYWIREENRDGAAWIPHCRVDLAVGYFATALFGMAMVIIGSSISVEGRGASLMVALGDQLRETSGPLARWVFLAGAFGAVFSSLVGTWQAVPLVFEDFWHLVRRGHARPPGPPTRVYWLYLLGLASVPMLGLTFAFREIQRIYAVIGAFFLPLLALALFGLGRSARLGEQRNEPLTTAVLLLILAFFAIAGWMQLR